ncbi:hypothetical_protein (plasmid) [Leishmania braziliensis MHOM/BR/75/M2904]|uniref:Hypothetical_protein n=1 Tax=Leishmania braziliensis MHOM/BR/75/M2904 TaxID=420245 RepID=A0A3P3Z1U7_LEIBR|nr:hypothetical_protein [Leishmania braziliensis MHOM/BR/75/M2904]
MALSASPSPSAAVARLSQIPTRATAATNAFVTSVGVHPIEPIQVVGLSSGEVCLYTAKTDTLSWFVEMNAARQAQLRVDTVTGSTTLRSSGSKANGGGAGIRPGALAPPEYPTKVLCFSTRAGFSIVHCGFLRGREEDLLREVVQRLQPSSSSSVARYLLYAITSSNDVYVVDAKTEVVFLHWAGGNSASGCGSSSSASSASPLNSKFIITQAETYGALIYLTVARRSAVKAATEQAASRYCQLFSGDELERKMYQRCNEPAVYVLHLGCTSPLAAPTSKGLLAGGGAYVLKAVPKERPHQTSAHQGGSAASANTGAVALSIRAHPLAPLLLLLLNESEVQVYAIDGDGGEVTPKKAQLIVSAAPSPSRSSVRSAKSQQLQPIIDAQFAPSAAVLVPCDGASHSSSSRKWICRNVQILLVTPTRLRLLCTRAAATTAGVSSADVGGIVATDRAFYTSPLTSAATSSPAVAASRVTFVRVWTWLGSPDTFFALQSDRVLVELSCNDFISASMKVLSVRSRRLLPPHTVTWLASGSFVEDAGNSASVKNWRLTPSSPAMNRVDDCVTAADGGRAAGLSCVQWPDVLPLWERSAILNGAFAPFLPATHSEDPHTLIFSRLTGLIRGSAATRGEEAKAESDAGDDTSAGSDVFHLSLLADTDTVSSRCICVRLCLTPKPSLTSISTAARPGRTLHPNQESVNVSVARLLCNSTGPLLLGLEHGFYFVGSRTESAYADYPFLIAGLLYLDSLVESEVSGDCAGRAARLRAAMVCLPADKHALRRLYKLARQSPEGDKQGNLAGIAVAPTSELKRAVLQAVQRTQIHPLPVPQLDFEGCRSSSAPLAKQLLGCAFQLSNDGVVPCVWSLWAPLPEAALTSSSKPAATAPPSHQQPVQLIMQSYYVAADTQELRWRPPELVYMDDLLVANPSQVFTLSSVLANASTSVSWASAAAAVPPPYKSVEDILLDIDPAVVTRLFLYYADRKVLVLATVETGSRSRNRTEAGGVMDDMYNFASRATNGRFMGGKLFTGGQDDAVGENRQRLCLIPHAAAEMNQWKADNTAESLSCSLLASVQLSAVMVSDHGDPALQVAVVSRRFGVALAVFPLPGRRGVARVSASLLPVQVHLCRRWDELLCVKPAVNTQLEESEGGRSDASAIGGGIPNSVSTSPLVRRYRAWVDTVTHSASTYASVPLALWVWSPAWPGEDEVKGEKATSAAAAASPVLLLQRGLALYVLHVRGAAVQMCASLPHCSPLQVVPCTSTVAAGGRRELYLQHSTHLSLVARSRLLRQLQLQYTRYSSTPIPAPAAKGGKAKWFKKFVHHARSSTAARLRLKEQPHIVEWLQRVYAPAVSDLAYESPSQSSGSAESTQMSAVLWQLTGTGTTHIGSVLHVNVTHLLRLATLAVEALVASQAMQQLVVSAGTLTASLQQNLQHITTVLERNNDGDDDDDGVAEPRTLRGSWAVAEALARLPLACVTWALSQEAVHAAAQAAAPSNVAREGVRDPSRQSCASAVRRWWWLVMRSSSLVLAVNRAHAEEAHRALNHVLDVIPVNSAFLQPMSMAAGASSPPTLRRDNRDEAEAVGAVTQALLLCSPKLMPHSVPQLLQFSDGSSASVSSLLQQQQKRLHAAVAAALETLGAKDSEAGADETAPLASLFSTVGMDGVHWTHAVYYTNLLGHLRHLASPEAAMEMPVREFASQCIKSADDAVESAAAAMLEVATEIVGVLLGDVVDVSAASRSRMATAVAQSMCKRHQALQQRHTGVSKGAAGRSAGATDGPPMEEDAYFLEHIPVDTLRHCLYESQWRDLYGTFAYPTRYFFRSTMRVRTGKPAESAVVTAAPLHYTAADLPYQVLYDSHNTAAMQRIQTPHADPNAPGAMAATSGLNDGQRRVMNVLLTEQSAASGSAAVAPQAVELLPTSSTPRFSLELGGEQHSGSTQQQSTPLSPRTAIAKEEDALHVAYRDAFAAEDEKEAQARAQQQQWSNSAGYNLHNDPLLQEFKAWLNAQGTEETVSASTTQRRKQQDDERQWVPSPSAFASSTRRVARDHGDPAAPGITTGSAGATEVEAVSARLYDPGPTQQELFTRFMSDD